ncbi:hypothetical protein Tco_0271141 [Tanacetum coccineum]
MTNGLKEIANLTDKMKKLEFLKLRVKQSASFEDEVGIVIGKLYFMGSDNGISDQAWTFSNAAMEKNWP